jgi:hypothetical protein
VPAFEPAATHSPPQALYAEPLIARVGDSSPQATTSSDSAIVEQIGCVTVDRLGKSNYCGEFRLYGGAYCRDNIIKGTIHE